MRSKHCGRRLAALARHEAEIQTADARCRRVQNGKAVPVFADRADRTCKLGCGGQYARAVAAATARPGR